MKVTSLKLYKGSVFEAVIDDSRKFYLHADIVADFNLHEGSETDSQQLKKIICASNFRRAYQRALYLLDYRDYSEKEMTHKLVQTYKSESLCSAVVERLKEHRLIDDERYAERLAQKYAESKKFGYRRAMDEIMRKGIDKFTAQDALEKYTDIFSKNLSELIEKKYSYFLTDSSDRKSVEKVKNSLVRYGYDFSDINRAVKEYFEKLEE